LDGPIPYYREKSKEYLQLALTETDSETQRM